MCRNSVEIVQGFCVDVSFKERDSAFVRKDATEKGKVTKVVIKRVVVDPNRVIETKLIDTLNKLWFDQSEFRYRTGA